MHKSKKNMVNIGSRVKFLHSTGTGIVRSIKGNIANVDVDGFEIPALVSDIVEVPVEAENAAIVRIGPSDPKHQKNKGGAPTATVKAGQRYGKVTINDDYEDDHTPVDVHRMKQQYASKIESQTIAAIAATPKIVEAAPYEDTEYVVKLAFVPSSTSGKAEASDLDAYIINDSSYELYYTVSSWRTGYVETIKSGKLEADTKELLKRFSRTSFAQIQTLNIGLLPFKPVNYVPQIVENFDIELHPLKFVRSGNYTENDYFEQHAFIFSLTDDNQKNYDIEDIKPKKEDLKTPAKAKAENATALQVEDLHIEHILESWSELSSGEVLTTQLARFKFVMDTAIKSAQHSKIVFIHGVGKGKLKYELKKILDREYPKNRYQDASFAEYGYGAIMVFV